MMLLAAFPMVGLLASCGATGRVTDTGCLWTKQIRVSQQDALTDLTAREILGHNKARAERCSPGDDRPRFVRLRLVDYERPER